jgi:hypothetical protein
MKSSIKKCFATLVNLLIMVAIKWLIVDFFGFGWVGYGKFCFYFSFTCFALATLMWFVAAVIEAF